MRIDTICLIEAHSKCLILLDTIIFSFSSRRKSKNFFFVLICWDMERKEKKGYFEIGLIFFLGRKTECFFFPTCTLIYTIDFFLLSVKNEYHFFLCR